MKFDQSIPKLRKEKKKPNRRERERGEEYHRSRPPDMGFLPQPHAGKSLATTSLVGNGRNFTGDTSKYHRSRRRTQNPPENKKKTYQEPKNHKNKKIKNLRFLFPFLRFLSCQTEWGEECGPNPKQKRKTEEEWRENSWEEEREEEEGKEIRRKTGRGRQNVHES